MQQALLEVVWFKYRNEQGFKNLILVDDFSIETNSKNWEAKNLIALFKAFHSLIGTKKKKLHLSFVNVKLKS